MKNNDEHMYMIRKISTLIGMWPIKLSGWKSTAYKMYTNTLIIVHNIFVISLLIKLVELLEKDFKEFDKALCVIISFSFGGYRYLICISQTIQECLILIDGIENETLRLADENIKKIHDTYKNYSAKVSVIFYSFSIVTILYIVQPLVHNIKYYESFNDSFKPEMIYQSWFPFDENEHYVLTFFLHFVLGKKYKMILQK